MSEDAEVENAGEPDGDGDEAPKKKGLFGNKIVLILLAVVLLGGGGGGAYAYFSGMFDAKTDVAEEARPTPSVYFDLPEMVVNLASTGSRSQYLKIKVALEAKEQTALDAIAPVMPRVLDMFQVYLRELRVDDLQGSAGVFRLKEELLRRINMTIHPNKVSRVLFKEIIVQ